MQWIHTLIEYIFPPHCAGCNAIGFELCEKCISHIRTSFPRTLTHIYVGFSYQDHIVKRTLKALKFKKRKALGKILGTLLHERIIEDISDEKAFSLHKEILVIPIPLSKKRFNERGFNQSEIIARSFSEKEPTLILDTSILIRTTHKDPQSSIHLKRERIENIQGVFSVRNSTKLPGSTCIILDDIVTTGSTLKEAEKVLRDAGVKKIILVSVAH